MENETNTTQPEGETSSVYIIGAIIIVAVIIAGVLLWPKSKKTTEGQTTNVTTPVVEEKAMISKLSCDKQWYNPMIGFPKYYLSAEGSALLTTKEITCTFTITSNTDGKVMATQDAPGILKPADERGGQTYECTTKAVELIKGANVTMKTMVKDDQGASASCAAGVITLP